MNITLSPKQEIFATALSRGDNQSSAYRIAFKPRASTSAKSVNESACRVASLIKVQSRVAELQCAAREVALVTHRVTTDTLLAEADLAHRIALSKLDPGGMIAATRLKAQLTGLMVRERENAVAPLSGITSEALESEIRRLRAERGAATP